MAKKYLDEQERKLKELQERREAAKKLEEEKLKENLGEITTDPFEVMSFWGSAENENLYVLEYLKEQEKF